MEKNDVLGMSRGGADADLVLVLLLLLLLVKNSAPTELAVALLYIAMG